ncbi:hypothetical protein [Acidimicrobium ferrooxidans]|nr:hypothetical protein [Acidimicrobium ferrooxidans]
MPSNTITRRRAGASPGGLRRLVSLQQRVTGSRQAAAVRNQLVAELHAQGVPTRVLAEQLGMSVPGVQRIIHLHTRAGG